MNQNVNTAPGLGAVLWHLHKTGGAARCELVKVPVGYEGRFFLNGLFLYSHQFKDVRTAREWALAKHTELRRSGWRMKDCGSAEPASLPVAS